MYLEHFQLNQLPFALTPNLSLYCGLSQHEEALELMRYGLSQGECLMKVVGEVGLGKTLLCRQLLNSLSDEYVTCYVFNPCLSGEDLLKAISIDLGIPVPKKCSRFDLIQQLNDVFLSHHQNNKRVVLLIDEAQVLSDEAIETLRLLTNLETDSSKLLQIILVGQPELDKRLEKANLRQIQQRIAYSCHLKPLNLDSTAEYLARRLVAAGHYHGQLFSKGAVKMLNRYACGVPRIINILSNKALLIASGRNKQTITSQDIKQAVQDSRGLVKTTTYYGSPLGKLKRRLLSAASGFISACMLASTAIFLFTR